MFEEICEYLEGVPVIIAGGVFVALSLILSLVGIDFPVDPAWVTFIICGYPIFYGAVKKLIKKKGISKISSSLLISTAMIASVIIGDIFAAGEIAFIMALGEYLEDRTTAKAKKGLKNLISLVPLQGRLVRNNDTEMVELENIKVGDVLRVLPGETIPVDGRILVGETSIDQSVMTGESLPVDKEAGDEVFGGTINRFGAIDISVIRVGEDSSLQKLIRMVKEAEEKQAPMQRVADKWASLLVPVAFLLAVIAGLLRQDIVVAVTVLVVFCPCALVLATPTAIMAAIGQATKHGVIIKSGEALEKMGKVDTITFDKTGTLTYGHLKVSDCIAIDKDYEGSLLSLVAAVESKSEHPLGKAIVSYAKEKAMDICEISDFSMEAGKGVSAVVNDKKIYCGSEKYLLEKGVASDNETSKILAKLREEGKASVIAATEGGVIGVIALSDEIRPDALNVVSKLNAQNVDVVLLTGDNKKTADYFASQVGIKNVHAELLPEEKVSNIVKLQESGKRVCMIGDGVNDAPALKTADVGVAMGTFGSDIAVEAADIALMGDDITKIPYLKKLSNATVKTIKFSISLSLIINFAAIVLSFFKLLTPATGALVHNAGSLFVILIAAMLYDRKFD